MRFITPRRTNWHWKKHESDTQEKGEAWARRPILGLRFVGPSKGRRSCSADQRSVTLTRTVAVLYSFMARRARRRTTWSTPAKANKPTQLAETGKRARVAASDKKKKKTKVASQADGRILPVLA